MNRPQRPTGAATSRIPSSAVLRVNPTACDGVAMCAHLAPDLITLDSWGFPIVRGHLTERAELRAARAAAAGCPRRALHVDRTH